jgi:RNA polymerase sigma factor (sigma-70 family)
MSTHDERFAQCWREDGPRVLAYARRQVGGHDAHDVVSETFLVAWRRWDEVPDPAIAWLLVTARQVVGNQRRSSRRHVALADRIALLDGVASAAGDTAEFALARREALEGLAGLTEEHREALLLVSWDGLTNDQAATVLGLRPAAFRRRISRARAALGHPDDDRPSQPRLRLATARPVLTTSKDLS